MSDITVTLAPPAMIGVTLELPAPIEVTLSGTQGIAGPPGIQGAPGTPGIQPFIFTQASATTPWLIAHGLGRYPSAIIVDSSGNQIEADVNYVDANNIMVSFSIPFAGSAYLN